MRAIRSSIVVLMLCSLIVAGAHCSQEVRVTNETEFGAANVNGPGAELSIASGSGYYSNLLGVNITGEEGATTYAVNLGGRATDNRTEDFRTLSLQNMQARIKNGNNTFNLGDSFETFTQYSASTGVKGLSCQLGDSEKTNSQITLLYGLSVPRWDNVYDNSGDIRTVKRQGYGVHLKQNLSPTFAAGAGVVYAKDLERVNPTDALNDGNVYGVDWEYKPFEGLSVYGESQFSQTNISPSDTSPTNLSSGSAHRLTIEGEGDTVRMLAEYERVSTGFYTGLGSAIPDREKAKVRWRERHGRSVTMTYSMLWYRNNLDGSQAYTRDNYRPEIGYTANRIFNSPYASAGLTYKTDIQNGGPQNIRNNYIDLNFRDRYGTLDSDTNIGYVIYDTSANTVNSREITFNTSWSTRYTVGDIVYRPNIYVGTWNGRDELISSTDTMFEYSVGMGVDMPKSRLNSSIRLGTHRLLKGTGGDTSRFFMALNFYYRPPFFNGSNNSTIFLKMALNDFNASDDTKDFSDTRVAAGVNLTY